jgi:hypothetical protein
MAELNRGLFYAITTGRAQISPSIRKNLPESIKRLYPLTPNTVVREIKPQLLERMKGATLASLKEYTPVVIDTNPGPLRKGKILSPRY